MNNWKRIERLQDLMTQMGHEPAQYEAWGAELERLKSERQPIVVKHISPEAVVAKEQTKAASIEKKTAEELHQAALAEKKAAKELRKAALIEEHKALQQSKAAKRSLEEQKLRLRTERGRWEDDHQRRLHEKHLLKEERRKRNHEAQLLAKQQKTERMRIWAQANAHHDRHFSEVLKHLVVDELGREDALPLLRKANAIAQAFMEFQQEAA